MSIKFFISLLALFSASYAHAANWGSDCTYSTVQSTITMPSGINISIDPNAPVGTVFFEYLPNVSMSGAVICNSDLSFSWADAYTYNNSGTYVWMSGNGLSHPSGHYPVYRTNVEGIGVVLRSENYALPYTYAQNNIVDDKLNRSWGSSFDVDIVKYGDVPAGVHTVMISSADMPVINRVVTVSNSSDTTKLPNGDIVLQQISFNTASFNFLSATCDTPDVSVNLGSREISDRSNIQNGKFITPWVDASIHLTGCPVFYGTGERGDTLKGTTRNNVMTVSLVPNNASNSDQGIMDVDMGSQAAEGVGIQLAWGTSVSPAFVDFSSGRGSQQYTMSPTQGATYTIPLVARYIQTAASRSEIKTGHANGRVTYLIDYY